MSIDKMIPQAPKWHLLGWFSVIATLFIVAAFYDYYWGNGNLFGLSKKQTKTA